VEIEELSRRAPLGTTSEIVEMFVAGSVSNPV
jgi:hypothetical protein